MKKVIDLYTTPTSLREASTRLESPADFAVCLEQDNTVTVAGSVDAESSHLLRNCLSTAVKRFPNEVILVDTRDVSFIDSYGLRAILDARFEAHEAGCDIVLWMPSPAVERLVDHTRSEDLFRVRGIKVVA